LGEGEFTVVRSEKEEGGRLGPGERLETVRDQLWGTTDYSTSFESSTCRLLMR
jgi:hypothetical protein